MSRVDEALRRALEQGTPVATLPPEMNAITADMDIASLAEEPFPIEMRERRPARKPIDAAPPPVIAPAEAPRSLGPAPVSVASSTLLERVSGTLAEKIVIDVNMVPASREQYRRLAATLHQAQATTGLKVVMVTSAVPGEGKTLTCSNLAMTFSESYQRSVLLIDADLRRPALHTVFKLDNSTGLSDGLSAVQERRLPIRQLSSRLAVLQAGKPTSDPMAGLTSERMRRLIQEARELFDWVIIDTPPVALLPDADLLTSMADGALLVVKAESTPYPLVKRAADALGRDRTLGVVLNRATATSQVGGYGYYADYYYGSTEDPVTT